MIQEYDYVITNEPVSVTIEVYPNGRVYKKEYNKATKQNIVYFKSKYGLFGIAEDKLSIIKSDYLKYGGEL